jgi:2-dehydro-3-deoxyglucarate aldolase
MEVINNIRNTLRNGECTIGSWMQIPHSTIAEIIGQSGYDWVAIDLEHGSIGVQQLPDLFRALELGGTLPLARLAHGSPKDCKQALDAGAGGVIIPMIESAEQLRGIRDACCWPPSGNRGVGFSRANLFGKNFDSYFQEAQSPLLIAMIESINAVDNLKDILKINGLDAIMVGPYDLSASMALTAKFDHPDFIKALDRIVSLSKLANIPCGIHVVNPLEDELKMRVNEGYKFIAYSMDSVFFNSSAIRPSL